MSEAVAREDSHAAVLRDVVAAVPDLLLAGTFLVTWVAPYTFGDLTVKRLLLLMLLEFIVVHSAGFMGAAAISDLPKAKIVGAMLGLGLLYSLFAGAFSLAFSSWWPLAAFWGLMANRLLGVLVGQPAEGREREFVMASWAAGAGAYLLSVFATVFTPVPRLGITPAVVSTLSLPGSGLWIEEPHRVVASGVIYFGLVGLWELFGRRHRASIALRTASVARRP